MWPNDIHIFFIVDGITYVPHFPHPFSSLQPNAIFIAFLGFVDLTVQAGQLPTMTGLLIRELGVATSQQCLCPLLRKEGTRQASRGTHRCPVSFSSPDLLWSSTYGQMLQLYTLHLLFFRW